MYLLKVSICLWSPEKRGRTFRIALSPAQVFQNQNKEKYSKAVETNNVYLCPKIEEIRAGWFFLLYLVEVINFFLEPELYIVLFSLDVLFVP